MLGFPDAGRPACSRRRRCRHNRLIAGLVAGAYGKGAFQQEFTMKRTYQASKVRRARTHGFLVRMKTRGGRAVINARRAKGRKRLAV